MLSYYTPEEIAQDSAILYRRPQILQASEAFLHGRMTKPLTDLMAEFTAEAGPDAATLNQSYSDNAVASLIHLFIRVADAHDALCLKKAFLDENRHIGKIKPEAQKQLLSEIEHNYALGDYLSELAMEDVTQSDAAEDDIRLIQDTIMERHIHFERAAAGKLAAVVDIAEDKSEYDQLLYDMNQTASLHYRGAIAAQLNALRMDLAYCGLMYGDDARQKTMIPREEFCQRILTRRKTIERYLEYKYELDSQKLAHEKRVGLTP